MDNVKLSNFKKTYFSEAANNAFKNKLEALRWGARWLYADDPDSFVQGCGDVSDTLEQFAKKLGLQGIKAVSGSVHVPGNIFLHAWLEVDGKIYDPRKDVERIHYSKHKKLANDVELLVCPSDNPWSWGDAIDRMVVDFQAGKEASIVELL